VWPDGKDVDVGWTSRRAAGTGLSGRWRGSSGFNTALATSEVAPIAAMPVIAARRPRVPPATARAAATPIHSRE
jgi:hypothetical protein